MRDRLKIWDAGRKNILALLPSPAIHLWLTYYSNEDDDQESYMSHAEIRRQMGDQMAEDSIRSWTKWLLERGWLVDMGKTAAVKFRQMGRPITRGANAIRVYRVDDPTKTSPSVCSPVERSDGNVPLLARSVQGSVLGSDSVSGSGLSSCSLSKSAMTAATPPVAEPERKKNGKPETQSVRGVVAKTKPKTAPDGTEYPAWFDDWSNKKRLDWLVAHGLPPKLNSKGQPMLDVPEL